MIITLTDLANAKIRSNASLGISGILKDLLSSYEADQAYKRALEGENYYSGDHDIKSHDFSKATILKVNPDDPTQDLEEIFRNPNASNIRTQHKFLFNHIEQKVSYISGKECSVSVNGAKVNDSGNSGNEEWEFQNRLTKTTDEKFNLILSEWERAASKHGVAWLHEYKDKEGKLRQVVVTALEGMPIYDTVHQQELVEFIRWYWVEANIAGSVTSIRKLEWWTANNVTYYTGDSKGGFILDPDYVTNPAPHYWDVTYTTLEDGVTPVEKKRDPKVWGRVPFVELSNNPVKLTDLQQYKDLIDAYDLISSKGTNNLMDFNEFYTVVMGFGGDTASGISKKLMVNRSISVGSQGGGLEMKQLDLQMQGRSDWLKELWSAIHFFGCAVDTNADRIGNAPSGVSLEFQYSLLDLKAELMIKQAKLAIKEHFWFITEDINRQEKTKYEYDLISIKFNKSRITNRLETVTMIMQSENIVPERMLLQEHPLVDDSDQAYKDLLDERKQKLIGQNELYGSYGSTTPIDDGEEHLGSSSESVQTDEIQKTALNGAQVQSMVEVVQSVAEGQMPRESGIAIIMQAFQYDKATAESILGSAGAGFVPTVKKTEDVAIDPASEGDQ